MSKLFRFRYLRLRNLLILTLILALASTLFSVTALSFLGFYNSFNAYLGEDTDIVAVYDAQSRTPFSGVVPAYFAERLGDVDGVLACSPEVITPCVIRNQTVFVRGALPDALSQVNSVVMVEGEFLESNSLDSVVFGARAADRLNVKVNDSVLVFATLADRYLELRVAGIYSSRSTMDDEALVQLNVGQWLRFSDYNRVTLIRVKINPELTNINAIYGDLAKNASAATPSSPPSSAHPQPNVPGLIPWSSFNFSAAKLGVTSTDNVMKSFLDRYGITKEAIMVLSVMVFFFSSVTIVVACRTFMQQHRDDLGTLRSLGVQRRLLRFDVVCKVLPLSFAASVLGTALAGLILFLLGGVGFLRVLSHGAAFSFDPVAVLLNFVLVSALAALSVVRWGLD